MPACLEFFRWLLGFKLGSPCLCDKHLTNCSVSPDPSSVAVIKHSDQKQLGGGCGSFRLTLPGENPPLEKVRADTQAGACSRTPGGRLFADLLSGSLPDSCLAPFLDTQTHLAGSYGTAHSGMGPPLSISNQDSPPFTYPLASLI